MDEKLSDFDDNFIVFNENAQEVLFMIRLYTSTHTQNFERGLLHVCLQKCKHYRDIEGQISFSQDTGLLIIAGFIQHRIHKPRLRKKIRCGLVPVSVSVWFRL